MGAIAGVSAWQGSAFLWGRIHSAGRPQVCLPNPQGAAVLPLANEFAPTRTVPPGIGVAPDVCAEEGVGIRVVHASHGGLADESRTGHHFLHRLEKSQDPGRRENEQKRSDFGPNVMRFLLMIFPFNR